MRTRRPGWAPGKQRINIWNEKLPTTGKPIRSPSWACHTDGNRRVRGSARLGRGRLSSPQEADKAGRGRRVGPGQPEPPATAAQARAQAGMGRKRPAGSWGQSGAPAQERGQAKFKCKGEGLHLAPGWWSCSPACVQSVGGPGSPPASAGHTLWPVLSQGGRKDRGPAGPAPLRGPFPQLGLGDPGQTRGWPAPPAPGVGCAGEAGPPRPGLLQSPTHLTSGLRRASRAEWSGPRPAGGTAPSLGP